MNEAQAIARPSAHDSSHVRGLEVRSIAKSYDKRAVLHDVSLSVARGEVVGLLGPNGAGKTTCFYSAMGLVKPDAGRVFLDGRDITRLPMYRRAILGLGYLPQETSIFRGLTVEQNIMAVLEVSEPDRNARDERLERLLGEFGLLHLRTAPAMALSGGERRRCEIRPELDAGIPTVRGDFGQLLQLADNLIGNALRYGCNARSCAIEVAVRREGPRALLVVRDHGDGIAADHIPRLTERFYRVDAARSRDSGGTGLGLAIVKHIVERHRGTIEIRSALGNGTEVSVALPLS